MVFELSLRVQAGDRRIALDLASDSPLTALVGPSGAGKTTILNCIAGLRRPDAGRIAVAGTVLFDARGGIDLPPEARHAGYLFQDTRLFPHLSVARNLAFGERLVPPARRRFTAPEITGLLGIGHLLHRAPGTLSGGEARRVAIGRALLSGPRVLLLDEPTAALDPERAEALRTLIEHIRDRLAIPILLVSHDRAEVERLAGAVAVLA